MDKKVNPFSLEVIRNPLVKWIIRAVSKINVLEACYDAWLQKPGSNTKDINAFLESCLDYMQAGWKLIDKERLDSVPQEGPIVFVANHPLGALEGLILTLELRRIRSDLKVLTNEMLSQIPEFEDAFIGVDVLNPGKAQSNAKGMRAASRHIASGGALLVFPAGTVSGISLPSLKVSDAPWSPMITRMASRYESPVMPIFVGGTNSRLFYLSAYIHKRLRTLLLPRAMVQKIGTSIDVCIGDVIEARDLKRLSNDHIATQYVRLCCEVLGVNESRELGSSPINNHEEIRSNACIRGVSSHIEQLDSHLLHQQERFSIYCVPYEQMGIVMEQLSIVREHTFRAVDEGTGKELDSDRFDANYQHLFLWDREKQQIAGGYRIGKTDEIARNFGLDGLYSHSLFDYNQQLLDGLGKTIEVGRSFVSAEYQKDPVALDLLWKGIGRFVAKNPKYHTLFGCVSISKQYSNLARSMLTQTFLSHYGAAASITSQVRARDPIKFADTPWSAEQLSELCDIPIVNKLVGRIDAGKSIPTLIRHYLSLNGRFVSFTNNSGFNDALDGFILVDLRKTQSRYLKRYLGKQGMQEFLQLHNEDADLSAIA